jgi:hypothetical protein
VTQGNHPTYVNSIQIRIRDDPVLPLHVPAIDRQRQILGHHPIDINHLNARSLQIRRKLLEEIVLVQLRTVQQAARPRKDGSDGVC